MNQYIGTVVDRMNNQEIVYRSRPCGCIEAQARAEARARRLGCGDRFAVRILDRYAVDGGK